MCSVVDMLLIDVDIFDRVQTVEVTVRDRCGSDVLERIESFQICTHLIVPCNNLLGRNDTCGISVLDIVDFIEEFPHSDCRAVTHLATI